MTNALQTQTNHIKEMIYEDLNKGQAKVFEGLVINAPINQIPEHVFRDYFLHGFAGNPPSAQWVAEWISVAGTPSSEVVVADSATGQELFRVPAMIASTGMVLSGQSRGRIADIFNHTQNISQNSPVQAMGFMNSALGEKVKELQASAQESVDARWQAIFARYGMAAVQSSVVTASGDDIFDY